jgi:hypothetical protein
MRFIGPRPVLNCPVLCVFSPVETSVALLLFVMNGAEIIRALRVQALVTLCSAIAVARWPRTHSISDGLDSAKEL